MIFLRLPEIAELAEDAANTAVRHALPGAERLK
jgi:hypothetical protein